MNLIRFAIDRPIAVIAGVILVVMFGVIALQTIPIQLIPDVRKPIVQIRTNWPGAAPAEVEREIVNRQEEALRGVAWAGEHSKLVRDWQRQYHPEFSGWPEHGPGAAAGLKPA